MKKLLSLCVCFVIFGFVGNTFAAGLMTEEYASLIRVIKNSHHYSQYFIEVVAPITHINDIDLQTIEGRNIATAIVLQCVELSKLHNDGDFTLHISCKRDRIIITVTLYSRSTLQVSSPCEFCDRKRFSGDIIAENNTTVAFEQSRPARNPINFLIVPKRHVVNYKDKNFKAAIYVRCYVCTNMHIFLYHSL